MLFKQMNFTQRLLLGLLATNVLLAALIGMAQTPQLVVIPEMPQGVAAVVMVAEEIPAESEHSSPQPEKSQGTRHDSPSPNYCLTLGPWDESGPSEQLQKQLAQDSDLKLAPRKKVETEILGYWVTIPSKGTEQQALAIKSKLERAGYDDLWVINAGPRAHSISLGYYVQREPAERIRSSLAQKGFKAVIEPKERERTRYWLDIQEQGAEPRRLRKLAGQQTGGGAHPVTVCKAESAG